MASELKPCPFCGATAKLNKYYSGTAFTVVCDNLHRINTFETEAEAVATWNTRPTPVDANPLASNPVDDKIAPDTDGNAPAAADTGLVTVAENLARTIWGYFKGGPDAIAWFDNNKSLGGPAWLIEQCRSQAEEMLAAERAMRKTAEQRLAQSQDDLKQARYDNAAKDARIKELEAALDSDPDGSGLWRFWSKESVEAHQQLRDKTKTIKALEAKLETYHEEYENRKEGYEKTIDSLEAKLAAAEKALEPFADHASDRAVDDTVWRDKDTVKIVVSIGDLRKARAVLGGKPS